MRLPWSPDGRGHVVLFLLVLAAGVGGIVALKILGWPQAAITAVPTALMLVYALLVRTVPLFRLRGDRAGDSCYYLGFLYTITSLGASLYTFAQSPDRLEPLIGDFGIALLTTFLGILLRVVFAQHREDAQDLERQTRIEVGEAARRFRAQLDNAVMEFGSFATAARLTHEELMREMAKQQLELVEQTTARLAEMTAVNADQVKAAVDGVSSATATFRDEAKKLNSGLRNAVKTMERISGDLGSLASPAAHIDRSVHRLVTALDGAAESLEARREADDARMQAIDKSILTAGKAAEAVRDVADDLRRGVDGEALGEALAEFGRGLKAWRERLDEGAAQTLALGKALRLVREEEVERLNQALAAQGVRVEALLAEEAALVDRVETRLVRAIDRLIAEVERSDRRDVSAAQQAEAAE